MNYFSPTGTPLPPLVISTKAEGRVEKSPSPPTFGNPTGTSLLPGVISTKAEGRVEKSPPEM